MGRNISKNVLNFNYKIMILVAKNADFSANSIGIVEIPRDFLGKTNEILSLYTGVSSNKANALNNFIFGITETNIIDKIIQLCIPALGSNKEEALIGCLSKEPSFRNADSLIFSDNEISLVGGEMTLPQLITNPQKDSSALISHLSLGAYIRKNPQPLRQECIFGNDTLAYFNRLQVANDQFTASVRGFSVSLYNAPYSSINTFCGFNFNATEGKAVIASGDVKKEKDFTVTDETVNTPIKDIVFGHYNRTTDGNISETSWNYTRKSFGLIYSAVNLTSGEFYVLKGLIEQLMLELYK